ncbi:hypothetical protein IF2G_06846 [Cordyceps javanica]|nr:hypothetical protein IF2G_06846 [Cordyceps javanica]
MPIARGGGCSATRHLSGSPSSYREYTKIGGVFATARQSSSVFAKVRHRPRGLFYGLSCLLRRDQVPAYKARGRPLPSSESWLRIRVAEE